MDVQLKMGLKANHSSKKNIKKEENNKNRTFILKNKQTIVKACIHWRKYA